MVGCRSAFCLAHSTVLENDKFQSNTQARDLSNKEGREEKVGGFRSLARRRRPRNLPHAYISRGFFTYPPPHELLSPRSPGNVDLRLAPHTTTRPRAGRQLRGRRRGLVGSFFLLLLLLLPSSFFPFLDSPRTSVPGLRLAAYWRVE